MSAEIVSITELLGYDLRIPNYQRPYRWTTKNVAELLADIEEVALQTKTHDALKYRIGTVILHRSEPTVFDIVDGQQRMITLTLLALCLDPDCSCSLLESPTYANRETKHHIHENYAFIDDWMSLRKPTWRTRIRSALKDVLEAVVIIVDKVDEAFQLFDSQNTRGRELDPHDLLKAYHLRAMNDHIYEMQHVVTRWESFDSRTVSEVFDLFLFPIHHWRLREKAPVFTVREIETFKGASSAQGYSYAARAQKAAPCFQIGAAFIEGEDFFHMVDHYLHMRTDIEAELKSNRRFARIQEALALKNPSRGYEYACTLFRQALFAYYDRFHNFDEHAVNKIFLWALMVRVDMESLGATSINKYAIGEANGSFTNVIPLFSLIARARTHTDISNLMISTAIKGSLNPESERGRLHSLLTCEAGGRDL